MAKLLSVVAILEKDLEAARSELEGKRKTLADIEANKADCKDELDALKKQVAELEKLSKEQEATIKRQIDGIFKLIFVFSFKKKI